jgi:hypothetical protein
MFVLFLTKDKAIKSVHFEIAKAKSFLSDSVIPGRCSLIHGKFICLFDQII